MSILDNAIQDIRFAGRTLTKNPGVTGIAVLSLIVWRALVSGSLWIPFFPPLVGNLTTAGLIITYISHLERRERSATEGKGAAESVRPHTEIGPLRPGDSRGPLRRSNSPTFSAHYRPVRHRRSLSRSPHGDFPEETVC